MGLLVVLAVEAVIVVVVLTVVMRGAHGRFYDRMLHARWVPMAPGPGHAPLRPVVEDLVAAGYVLDSFAELPSPVRPTPLVALVHPDGTMAMVINRRSLAGLSYIRLTIESIVLPGERSLTTMSGSGVAKPEDLLEVASRRPDVARARQVHERNRAWLEAQGVHVHPVRPGEAGRTVEAEMHTVAQRRPTVPFPVLLWYAISGGGRFRRPLPERPEVRRTIEAIRARQHEHGAVR